MPSVPYNVNPCARRGTCMTGCPEGAKSTANITLWPHALKDGARIVVGARVREITYDAARNRVTGATYIDRNGRERHQKARTVILCGNGIGTPRLLLLRLHRVPGRPGQLLRLVGKRLMMHPFSAVLGVFEEDLESWRGPFGHLIESNEFYETDEKRGFMRGAKWGAMPAGGPLGVTGFVGSKIFDEGGRVEDSWGANLHDLVDRRFGHSMVWGIIGEDLPEESNRVMLDPELTDTDGIPAPKLDYTVSENSSNMLSSMSIACWRRASRSRSRPWWCIKCRIRAGTCLARRAWATTPAPRWWTNGAARTTCLTSSSSTPARSPRRAASTRLRPSCRSRTARPCI